MSVFCSHPCVSVTNAAFTPLLRWWTYITIKSDRRIWWRAVYIWWRSLPWSCIPNFGFSTGMEITGDTPRSPFRFKRWLKFLIILIVLYSKKCSYELQIFEAVPLQMWDGKNSRVLTWNIYRTAGQVLKQISYIFQHRTGVRYYPWSPFPMGRRISKSPRCTYIARWWFQMCFIFTPIWGNDPIWLIFFRWVETTNQTYIVVFLMWNFVSVFFSSFASPNM